ncbi:MAG: redoxin domain-containing protein [Pseudomonadota bacterium]|nr:redoxin domain-containing protein [Gammaproteobacteria bacterium]MBU1559141.1 redoxin domain-containing protein [Gammaproteobacteria bacterium]MBU1629008.1 redoxin domain-containing protein [Gammaproteobacteria bacterium]MBU1926411.1 redoxin domain-containing protein [Gammaproteobacteria bacterium]MBU2545518.1 redoxin domain-containing protein [Gammaproteobacteria bacterium]
MATLVGQKAPDFTAAAVLGSGEIKDKYDFLNSIKNKYALLFFYPLDFTFVCPSELIALDHRREEFKKRNIEVIGISVDSPFTHNAWRCTPVNKGGIGPVSFTLVADLQHAIAKTYGIEHPTEGVAFRAAFVIDKNSVVRSSIVNDLPIGRNIDEILRLFDAVEFFEQNGEVCPANWRHGDKGMKASTSGVAEYLSKHGEEL